ncbi:MAG: metallophosphoesterase family protein [Candidatus Helarchaeota archaeon]
MKNSLKIGVIADTHIPTRARNLPARLFEIFQDVDYIIHAGDYVTDSVIEELKRLAPVTGCYGNMDPTYLKAQLPKIAILKLGKYIIKVIHDLGGNLYIRKLQNEGPVNIIIHGHTHRASIQTEKGILLFNPGSATNTFLQSPTVGVLYLEEHRINSEIIKVSEN